MKPISKIASNLLERKTIKEIAIAIANTLTKTMVITMKTTTTTIMMIISKTNGLLSKF